MFIYAFRNERIKNRRGSIAREKDLITGSACFKNCHRISRKVTGVRSHVFTRAPAHGTNIHASHRFIFHRYITVVSVSLPLHDSARSLSSLEKTMIHRVHRDLPFRYRSSSSTVTFSTFMLDFLFFFLFRILN